MLVVHYPYVRITESRNGRLWQPVGEACMTHSQTAAFGNRRPCDGTGVEMAQPSQPKGDRRRPSLTEVRTAYLSVHCIQGSLALWLVARKECRRTNLHPCRSLDGSGDVVVAEPMHGQPGSGVTPWSANQRDRRRVFWKGLLTPDRADLPPAPAVLAWFPGPANQMPAYLLVALCVTVIIATRPDGPG